MKIGIIGLWIRDNHGAALTGWALYSVLQKMGHTPVLIDLSTDIIKGGRPGEFIRERCKTTREYMGTYDLSELNKEFDVFLVGSDQNWRGSGQTEEFGFSFFLDFVRDDKKMVSYATSFGNETYDGSDWEKEIIKRYLKRFDNISVREKKSAEIYSEMLGREIFNAIDPVFLLDKGEYVNMMSYHNNGGTLTEVFLDYTQNLKTQGAFLAGKIGMPEKLMLPASYSNVEKLKIPQGAVGQSVEEFLSAIMEAGYILTDSYHGMCFAIIFHIPFMVILNEARGKERFLSILERLGLTDRIWNASRGEDDSFNIEIDWDSVDRVISDWKKSSMEWLKKALLEGKSGEAIYREAELAELITGETLLWRRISHLETSIQTRIDKDVGALFGEINRLDLALSSSIKGLVTYCDVLKENIICNRTARLKGFFREEFDYESRIAIRGGGVHTQRLLKALKDVFEEKRVKICFIVDKKDHLDWILPRDVTLVTPEEFWDKHCKTVDVLILSTGIFKEEIRKETDERCNDNGNLRVIDPYSIFGDDELRPDQCWFDL